MKYWFFSYKTQYEIEKGILSDKCQSLKYIKYEYQKELLEACCHGNPEDRLSFDEIYFDLAHHQNILHSVIDEQELINYFQKFDQINDINES